MVPVESAPDSLFTGGAQKRIFQMALYFSSKGYRVFLGSDDEEDQRLIQELEINNIKHIKIPFRSGVMGQTIAVKNLFNAISENKIRIVHSNDRRTSFFGWLASKILDVSYVYTARNEFFNQKITGRFFGNNIIAISDGVRHNLINFFGVEESKIKIIYNGSDIKHSSLGAQNQVRHDFNLENTDRIISVIGRLSEQKGLKFLLRGSVNVLSEFANLKILLVGDGELRQELKSEVVKLNLERNVLFCGNQEDVASFIDISEFTIIPSVWEGLGVSAIESMMLGKPVIASGVGGLPEVVENGETGLIVAPKDSSALSTAIKWLLGNPQITSEMGIKAKERAENKFSLEQMMEEYSRYFKKIVSRR